jgi:hypothetical protein
MLFPSRFFFFFLAMSSYAILWLFSKKKYNAELNVFENIHRHYYFIVIFIITAGIQALIVEFGFRVFRVNGLNYWQWLVCLFLGSLGLIIGVVSRILPDWEWPRGKRARRRHAVEAERTANMTRERLLWQNAIGSIQTQLTVIKALKPTTGLSPPMNPGNKDYEDISMEHLRLDYSNSVANALDAAAGAGPGSEEANAAAAAVSKSLAFDAGNRVASDLSLQSREKMLWNNAIRAIQTQLHVIQAFKTLSEQEDAARANDDSGNSSSSDE